MMDETELIERGWRRCAAGQRTTQWCAQAEEQRRRDEKLMRIALDALRSGENTKLAVVLISPRLHNGGGGWWTEWYWRQPTTSRG